ncbi:hypothetical protein WDL1P2_00026 (plasmid) [Variovorax sp. WDL1]|nr:hypothetical protein APY03_6924 [Variovorax sp. WDL1]PNG48882.1 hypothetical protein CHC06_06650 [Variovorax sp. B2]PNG49389.1 hypothetical protein CHC07_06298 [Variovorax sp. B4]VTV18310.1 hypothetical protein WDL1P2_00026 [Variovorax sp. WDL1]
MIMPPIQSYCQTILCLDFDGVLHRASDAIHVASGPTSGPLLAVQMKAQGRLIWLGHLVDVLVDRPDVAILVHSTWRRKFDQATLAHLLGELSDRVIQPPGYFVDLGAPAPEFIRQSLDWVNESRREAHLAELTLDEIVVIDDRPEFFASDEGVAARLLLSDPNQGLSVPQTRGRLAAMLDAARSERVAPEHGAGPTSKF